MTSKVKTPTKPQYDESRTMKAVQWYGNKDVRVGEVPMPMLTDPTDAIIKVTASTVCGSDLHVYHNLIPGMSKGCIMGHESVGIVEEIGPEVKNFKKGDRVAISAIAACGKCEYCKRKEWSCCDTTNKSDAQAALYGHNTGALFGFGSSFGGLDGCQAEYVRVVFADTNLFPIPANITDRQAILVTDILCTGYHGTELANVKTGDNVVVFGCGPVGLCAQMWAFYRGAKRVIAVDIDQQRLEFAHKHFGSEIVNSKNVDPVEAVKSLIPGGPDKVIDCVGFRFPDSLLHKVEQTLKLESDSPNIVNSAIMMCRKNGVVTLIGDYTAYTNHFNIGALMEKHLTMNGGQLWPHNYYKLIFEAIANGKVHPTVLLTHDFTFSKFAEAYQQFDNHEAGIIKAFIIPDDLSKSG